MLDVLGEARTIQAASGFNKSAASVKFKMAHSMFRAEPDNRNLTLELTRRPMIATTDDLPHKHHESQAEGGRVQ
jgi:hypothetical protein